MIGLRPTRQALQPTTCVSAFSVRVDGRHARNALRARRTRVGFDPVDAGPLRIARYTEPFTLLIAQLAYEGKGGPELVYRFERFEK